MRYCKKRYDRAPIGTRLSTTGRIPPEFLHNIEINKDLNKFKLVELYDKDIILGIARDYIITTISILDGLFEDIYEIILEHEGYPQEDVFRKLVFGDGALPFVLVTKIPDLRGRKNQNGFELQDYFYTYEVLRQIRHAIIHNKGVLSNRHKSRISKAEESIPREAWISNSSLIKMGDKIQPNIEAIILIRKWTADLLATIFADLDEVL